MSIVSNEISIRILGKSYQIRCPEGEVDALQRAARYLEEKMRPLRDVTTLAQQDNIVVIAALNVVHQLLTVEQQKEGQLNRIHQRLHVLQNKVDHALTRGLQMELQAAE